MTSASTPPPPTSRCSRCGGALHPVSRPRDTQGRVLCTSCAAKLRPGSIPVDPNPLPLADGLPDSPPPPPPAPTTSTRPCPACSATIGAASTVCASCGYNDRTGFSEYSGAGASPNTRGVITCPTCGYNLKGLRKAQCPECGTRISRPSRRDLLAGESRRTDVAAYRRSVIIAAGAVLLLPIAAALHHGFTADALARLAIWTGLTGLWTTLGIISFWGLTLTIFAGGWPLTLLLVRSGSVLLASAGTAALCSVVVSPTLSVVAAAVVFAGLSVSELDLDPTDAAIYTVVCIASVIALAIVVWAVVGIAIL